MNVERWRKIEQVYLAALDCETSEQPAFLEQACAGDEEMRRKVEALLGRDQQAERFLQSPVLEMALSPIRDQLKPTTRPRLLHCSGSATSRRPSESSTKPSN